MENNKIIADYLEHVYIPFNDLQGFPKPGIFEVYKNCKPIHKLHPKKGFVVGNDLMYFKGRKYNEMYFDTPELLKVVEKLENEDLRRYGYKWTFGDEQYFNNLGLSFTIWRRGVKFEMDFELDPSQTVCRKEFSNYHKDFRDKLEEVVVETIKYVNRIKIEK